MSASPAQTEERSAKRIGGSEVLILTPVRALFVWVLYTLTALFLNDVLALFNSGGVFSLLRSLQSADAHSNLVDIDDAGLRIFFISAAAFVTLAVATIYRPSIYDSNVSATLIAISLCGGSLIDAYNDQKIVDRLLSARGYTYCRYGDYRIGHGKGSVWFHRYALDPKKCPSSNQPQNAAAD